MLECKRTKRDEREEGYVLFAVKFFVSYPCSIYALNSFLER
jgi:hypothetical protein